MYNKALIFALVGNTLGNVLWDGSFNDCQSAKDLEKCGQNCGTSQSGSSGTVSASAQVNIKVDVAYKWFIKGSESTDKYVELSDKYKNQADTECQQGAKLTVDSTSKFENRDSLRTELVAQQKPQEKRSPLNKGKVAHHFSFKHGKENSPDTTLEHQLCYFDSGLTEMKYGCGMEEKSDCGSGNKMKWHVEGESKWEEELKEEEWHNCVYEIDYDKKEVSLWHSKEGEVMEMVSGPHKCNKCESNGKDWHVGVNVQPREGKTLDQGKKEEWYVSGCYVEEGGEFTKKPVSNLKQ
ncbi:hypothetical protein IWX90DRAFT_490477 [Phyllosticta citrichinensis]|uniref:Glycoside hydrolase 131 catalytic N-terminal domain-containing protein n=1 Tax=Phyllosticta citrichinensis TaxID=1130410 RepID=A0ABR1XFT0_9PEZI